MKSKISLYSATSSESYSQHSGYEDIALLRGKLYNVIGKTNHLRSVIRIQEETIEKAVLRMANVEKEINGSRNNMQLLTTQAQTIDNERKDEIDMQQQLKQILRSQRDEERREDKLKKFLKKHQLIVTSISPK